MVEEGEIINLIFGVAALFIFLSLLKESKSFNLKMFRNGFFVILCAYLFTVVEGFFFEKFFNLLEHLCYVLSGFYFLIACINLPRSRNPAKDEKK